MNESTVRLVFSFSSYLTLHGITQQVGSLINSNCNENYLKNLDLVYINLKKFFKHSFHVHDDEI